MSENTELMQLGNAKLIAKNQLLQDKIQEMRVDIIKLISWVEEGYKFYSGAPMKNPTCHPYFLNLKRHCDE